MPQAEQRRSMCMLVEVFQGKTKATQTCVIAHQIKLPQTRCTIILNGGSRRCAAENVPCIFTTFDWAETFGTMHCMTRREAEGRGGPKESKAQNSSVVQSC